MLYIRIYKTLSYTATAKIGSSREGFHATKFTDSSSSQILRHLPVSISQIRTVPSLDPLWNKDYSQTQINQITHHKQFPNYLFSTPMRNGLMKYILQSPVILLDHLASIMLKIML